MAPEFEDEDNSESLLDSDFATTEVTSVLKTLKIFTKIVCRKVQINLTKETMIMHIIVLVQRKNYWSFSKELYVGRLLWYQFLVTQKNPRAVHAQKAILMTSRIVFQHEN